MKSYPSIYALGHQAVADILTGPVVVQEKIDGSMFSFGIVDDTLVMRSKGAQIFPETTDQIFAGAVATAHRLAPLLRPGWTYRGEALFRPKHNTLAYARVPAGHIILFDVDTGEEAYLIPAAVAVEAAHLGLEHVPTFPVERIADLDALKALLTRESVLGGTTIEGVVLKAYGRYGKDKKTLMAKYVSEAFKEVHAADWRERNPTRGDIIQSLIAQYRTDARWAKAVQHLRDAGQLEGSPRDIGPLLKAIPADVEQECRAEIMAALYEYAWPQIRRGLTAGFPQWYKDDLAKAAFEVVH